MGTKKRTTQARAVQTQSPNLQNESLIRLQTFAWTIVHFLPFGRLQAYLDTPNILVGLKVAKVPICSGGEGETRSVVQEAGPLGTPQVLLFLLKTLLLRAGFQ